MFDIGSNGKKYQYSLSQPKTEKKDYQVISSFTTNEENNKTDILELMGKLSPASQVLLLELKRTYTPTNNVVTYPKFSTTDSQKYKTFSKYITPIIKLGIIKRIAINHVRNLELSEDNYNYLFNPEIINCTRQQQAKYVWKMLN
jgi:hypothetical protein